MSDARLDAIKWVFAILPTFLISLTVGICVYTGYKSKAITIGISGLFMVLSMWMDIGQGNTEPTNCLVEVQLWPCKVSFLGLWGYTLALMNIIMPQFVFPRHGIWGVDPAQSDVWNFNTICCLPLASVPFMDQYKWSVKCRRALSPSKLANQLCARLSCCRCGWVWSRWVKFFMFIWMCMFVIFIETWGSLEADFASSFFWVLYLPVLGSVMKHEYNQPHLGEKLFISLYTCLVLFQGVVTTVSIGYEWKTRDANSSLPLGSSFYMLLLLWPLLTLIYFRWFLYKLKSKQLSVLHAYGTEPNYQHTHMYIQQFDAKNSTYNKNHEKENRIEMTQFAVDMNPSDEVEEYKNDRSSENQQLHTHVEADHVVPGVENSEVMFSQTDTSPPPNGDVFDDN
jgi:hypothetical protein